MLNSDSLFMPPEESWEPLSPKFLPLHMVRTLISWTVALGLAVGAVWIFITDGSLTWLRWTVLTAALVVLVWRLVRVPALVRRWGYAEHEDHVYVTHGLWQRNLTCVPYGRMQLVEVTAGPIERAFGLATVEMVTASHSGSVSIPGLDRAAAEAMRDRFIGRGEHLQAGI